jgi:hypothetical protein
MLLTDMHNFINIIKSKSLLKYVKSHGVYLKSLNNHRTMGNEGITLLQIQERPLQAEFHCFQTRTPHMRMT